MRLPAPRPIAATALALALWIAPAFADVDQTVTAARAAYGNEVSREEISAPGWHELEFRRHGLSAVCYADASEHVRAVTYYRTDRRLKEEELASLRTRNAHGSTWAEHPRETAVQLSGAPPMPWQDNWTAIWRRVDDTAVAILDDDGWLYIRTTAWLKILLGP